ncbi:MAG: hypothetical protein JKY99_04640 [Rhizobiales bacterium]|nr:hypothetical protein [Hyphomicrobiales bacterium]
MKAVVFALSFFMICNLCIVSHAADIRVVKEPNQNILGPYSQAIIANGFLFASGVIAINPETGKLAGDTIQLQTQQVFTNIRAVLAAGGATLNDVVKVTVFLKNPHDFPAMNEIYADIFKEYKPARTTVPGVEWGPGILIEIDVIAAMPKEGDSE